MLVLLIFAVPIAQCFIRETETVQYAQSFLRIICLACPTTAINFLIITVFQTSGAKVRPLILSLLRKGSLDIPLMLMFRRLGGITAISWATPVADFTTLVIAVILLIPFLQSLERKEPARTTAVQIFTS